jgi:hypothetical protein
MYNSSIITKTLSHRFVCDTKSNTIKTISSLTLIVATNIIALSIAYSHTNAAWLFWILPIEKACEKVEVRA